jgi:hypothetical protein
MDLTSAVLGAVIQTQGVGEVFSLVICVASNVLSRRMDRHESGALMVSEYWLDQHRRDLEELNNLIRAGRFNEAEAFVGYLGLSHDNERLVRRQIAEIRERMVKIQQWNDRLKDFASRGDFKGAMRFVKSLDLPEEDKAATIRRIEEVAHTYQATAWIREWTDYLNSLVGQGDFDAAIRFARSLDLPQEAKDRLVALIDDIRWGHQ